jgi:hypothetical protein
MYIHRKFLLGLTTCVAATLLFGNFVRAEDKEKPAEPQKLELAEGKLELTISGDWKKIAPKSRIIEFEFSVPAVEGDEQPGRVTVMGAGGSIEANIDRWMAQFIQPDGSETKDSAKVDEKTVGGQKVTTVDIAGTYDDRPPFPGAGVKGVMREKYRMLSMIIQTEKLGNYFVKFYGPAATIEKNKAAFDEMVKSLQTKK